MKVIVTVLNDSKTLIFEIDENEFIESISLLLNRELKSSNVEYAFIFNKAILEKGKTLAQLNLYDNCKIYAIKERILKRSNPTEPVINVISSDSKKRCVAKDTRFYEHNVWNNKSLLEIQKELSETVQADPSLFESIILHPSTKEMIENPSLVTEMFSANPSIDHLIKTEQERVKFITDKSQYTWIQDIIASPDQLDRIVTNHNDHVQHVLSSTRYKRMLDSLNKASKTSEESVVTTGQPDELEDFADDVLETITKSSVSGHIIDLMRDNHMGLTTSILRACPYGSTLTEDSLNALQMIMPASMDRLKEAITNSSDPANVVEYLRSNPIEVEPEFAAIIEQVTGQFGDVDENRAFHPCISTLVHELHQRTTSDSGHDTGELEVAAKEPKFDREMALLNEVGFVDSAANAKALQSSYGNIDHAVASLLYV